MPCDNCGRGLLTVVEADPVQSRGNFHETWECNVCGALGFVDGRQEKPPRAWKKYGAAFESNP